jgi:dihydroneopterin aldolase / 2-amino-4-hydroxy-6-hydroxymethyldihydropteridine diphosphokinase
MNIIINGINTKTIIGVYPHERGNPQDLIVNLKITLDDVCGISDDLEFTIDYDEVIQYVKDLVEKTNYKLLEKLSRYINQAILNKYSIAIAVEVELIKTAICGELADEIKLSNKSVREYEVALALGSNADNLPQQQIITAIEILNQYLSEVKIAKLYKTKPYGFLSQNNFYNTVITAKTKFKPDILFAKIKKLEKIMGKNEICINGPRVIDIDILLFEDIIYQNHFLIIPHPRMHLRDFVLQPLADIADDLYHPVFKKNIKTLLAELNETDKTIIALEEYVIPTN